MLIRVSSYDETLFFYRFPDDARPVCSPLPFPARPASSCPSTLFSRAGPLSSPRFPFLFPPPSGTWPLAAAPADSPRPQPFPSPDFSVQLFSPSDSDLKTLHGSLLRDFLPYEALSKKVNAHAEKSPRKNFLKNRIKYIFFVINTVSYIIFPSF